MTAGALRVIPDGGLAPGAGGGRRAPGGGGLIPGIAADAPGPGEFCYQMKPCQMCSWFLRVIRAMPLVYFL